MDVLSYPFRVAPNGSAATVRDGSTAANTEAVAVLALTRKGERVLVPTFGTTDPVLTGLDVAELNTALTVHGPVGVRVTGVETTPTGPGSVAARLEFTENPVDGIG